VEAPARKDPWHRNRLIRDGIYMAIAEEMAARPEIYLMGEGSHMKVHFDAPGIERDFPGRCLTLPISEDGNANFAVGASLAGVVPIVDVISSDFLYRCMDGICNTMAKAEAVGRARTMVVRAEFLTGGPTSGQRIEALFAHIPGLHVYVPSSPRDAYALMMVALGREGVTVFFEDRMIADSEIPDEEKLASDTPSSDLLGSLWRARVFGGKRRASPKVTVASYGIAFRRCWDLLRDDDDCNLVDLRSLYPLDVERVIGCVDDGALLVVEPDVRFLGIGAELVAEICERRPGTRVMRLGAPRKTIPASAALHHLMLPSDVEILSAVRKLKEPA